MVRLFDVNRATGTNGPSFITRMGQGGGSGPTRLTGGHASGTGPASSSASAPLGKASAAARAAPKKQVSFGDDVGDGAAPANPLPKGLKSYVREVESKSGMSVHPKQREMLAEDLRKNRYEKLTTQQKAEHSKPYTPAKRDELISQWEENTGQQWPTYMAPNPRTGAMEPKRFQAHHINPQKLQGKHEWWNMHPVHPDVHQGGIHGSGAQLTQILREMK